MPPPRKLTLATVLAALWEGPQNALGVANFAVQLALRNIERVDVERGRIFVELRRSSAVSPGRACSRRCCPACSTA